MQRAKCREQQGEKEQEASSERKHKVEKQLRTYRVRLFFFFGSESAHLFYFFFFFFFFLLLFLSEEGKKTAIQSRRARMCTSHMHHPQASMVCGGDGANDSLLRGLIMQRAKCREKQGEKEQSERKNKHVRGGEAVKNVPSWAVLFLDPNRLICFISSSSSFFYFCVNSGKRQRYRAWARACVLHTCTTLKHPGLWW